MSSEYGRGYDAGQVGMRRAIATAELLSARRERDRIIQLLEDNFYPLDYPRWQADELMEEIIKLIRGEEQ